MWPVLTLAVVLQSGDPCVGKGTIVLVEARRHVMSLCEQGRRAQAFRISIGRGGIGKQREGDHRLPLGRYSLAHPRPSKDWHRFILIGYPTAEQRRSGLTGGAVGIHGPPRHWQGPTVTDTDWTFGCIAVGTDAELDAIEAWLKTKRRHTILIEDQ
jgi:murein L,D-transpeptidase YafK